MHFADSTVSTFRRISSKEIDEEIDEDASAGKNIINFTESVNLFLFVMMHGI